jgi:hypothetical protein
MGIMKVVKTEYYIIGEGAEWICVEKTKEEIVKSCQTQKIAKQYW